MTDINQLLERLQKQQDAIGSAIMVIKAFSSEQALPPGLQVNSIIDQAHTLTTTAIHENAIVNGAAVNGSRKKKPPMTPELKAIISAKTKAAWAARKKAAAELAAAVATANEAKAAKRKAAKKAIAA